MAEPRLQLPTFSTPVEDWLVHVHGYLSGTQATSKQKHSALVGALPTDIALQVSNTITSPTADEEYSGLRKALLEIYKQPDSEYLRQLNNLALGVTKPSELWRSMQRLNNRCTTPIPEALLKEIHLQKLPQELAVALAVAPATQTITTYLQTADLAYYRLSLRAKGPSTTIRNTGGDPPGSSAWIPINQVSVPECPARMYSDSVPSEVQISNDGDHITSVSAPNRSSVYSSRKTNDQTEINALSNQVKQLTDKLNKLLSVNPTAPVRSEQRYHNSDTVKGMCWYHAKFGALARQCRAPCSYSGNE